MCGCLCMCACACVCVFGTTVGVTLEREEKKREGKRDGSALSEGSWHQYRVTRAMCVCLSVYLCVLHLISLG